MKRDIKLKKEDGAEAKKRKDKKPQAMNVREAGAAQADAYRMHEPDDSARSLDISNISKKENYLLDKIKFGDISMHKMAASSELQQEYTMDSHMITA